MWTRPSDRAPSYGPCGQALEKLALPHRLPTLGALAPTSSPLLQQRFMRTATAPTPTASQIAPSSQAIRLRNKPANSPEDSTRQSAKQQPGQVRRAWWRTQVNRPLSVPELSSRCRTPGRRTTAQRPSSCPQGPATSPAMPDTGHRDSRISAATSLFISSQKSMQKTIVFHEIYANFYKSSSNCSWTISRAGRRHPRVVSGTRPERAQQLHHSTVERTGGTGLQGAAPELTQGDIRIHAPHGGCRLRRSAGIR